MEAKVSKSLREILKNKQAKKELMDALVSGKEGAITLRGKKYRIYRAEDDEERGKSSPGKTAQAY